MNWITEAQNKICQNNANNPSRPYNVSSIKAVEENGQIKGYNLVHGNCHHARHLSFLWL